METIAAYDVIEEKRESPEMAWTFVVLTRTRRVEEPEGTL